MKGPKDSPVYAFLTNPSMVDYPGHLAALFFFSGCNFECRFCHNPELIRKKQDGISWKRLAEACQEFRENWVDAAVITGGEPTLWEELSDCIAFFRKLGWRIKLDTNGSRPEMLERCLPMVDYVAMDVKTGLSSYAALTGCDDPSPVRRSIALIKEGAADYEFRTTVIESQHSNEQMDEIAEMIRGARRYVLQPFLPREEIPDAALRNEARTAPARLVELAERMRSAAEEIVVRGE